MLPFLSIPAQIVSLLESNVSPREIAAGVCLGIFLGLIPLNGPAAVLLILFFFLFRINRISTLLTLPLFKAAYLMGLSGIIEKFGGYLLIDARPLSGFWALVTNLPVIAYLDLNNTLVAGGLAASAILSIPVYFIAKPVSAAMKNAYQAKVKNSKIAKSMSGLKLAGKVDTAVNLDSGISLNIKGIWRVLFGSVKARMLAGRPPAKGFRKRVNITGVIIFVIVILVIQFGVGLAISPMAGSLIVDTINHNSKARVEVDRVNIWPLTLSFSMNGLKVFDPEDPNKRIVKSDAASFRLSPIALLSRKVVFSSVKLEGAEIDLEGKPDGSFNIQGLGGAGKEIPATDAMSMWSSAQKNKDLFGKLYGLVKKRFSKEALAKRKTEADAKKGSKTVTDLPKGRSVHFKSGPGAYLFEIKDLHIDNGYIKIKADGQVLEIDKAQMALGRIAVDPDSGTKVGLFSIRGDVSKDGSVAGKVDILFSHTERTAKINADLKYIDLAAVRAFYQDSLPVNVVKGRLTLSSRTAIKDGSIDSRTTLSLTGHEFAPKSPGQFAFGVIPVSAIVEALNGMDPMLLKFTIGGTLDKPEFGGFQESLMTLVTPYISNIKDKVIKEGTAALKNIIRKNLFGKGE
jgi:uncharacterized protein (TIGR03546 family)